MAMIAIKVTKDIGRLFEVLDIPGNRKSTDHITLFYLGKNLSIKQVVKMIPVIYEITSELSPFKVSTNVISNFDKRKHGYPVIAKIQSKDLDEFRKKLKKAFDKNKIKYDDTFSDFNPHLTLSYSDEEIKDLKFDKIDFLISEISIFGGDEADGKLFVNFPFSLNLKKKASYTNSLAEWFYEGVKT